MSRRWAWHELNNRMYRTPRQEAELAQFTEEEIIKFKAYEKRQRLRDKRERDKKRREWLKTVERVKQYLAQQQASGKNQ